MEKKLEKTQEQYDEKFHFGIIMRVYYASGKFISTPHCPLNEVFTHHFIRH